MDMGPSDLPAWYWVSGASFLGFSLLDKVASHVQNVEVPPPRMHPPDIGSMRRDEASMSCSALHGKLLPASSFCCSHG